MSLHIWILIYIVELFFWLWGDSLGGCAMARRHFFLRTVNQYIGPQLERRRDQALRLADAFFQHHMVCNGLFLSRNPVLLTQRCRILNSDGQA